MLEVDSHAVGDSDSIVQPITVEEFPDHCKSMSENANHPFAEEFQVMTILTNVQIRQHYGSDVIGFFFFHFLDVKIPF